MAAHIGKNIAEDLEKKGARQNELLSRHSNFRIGGPADYFFEARNSEEIIEAVRAAEVSGLPFFIMGGGSNILISDDGFRGLVIKAANRNWEIKQQTVYAEAGMLSAFLARKTAEAGLAGFEWAISLPGTIGGAIFGNAGCFGGEVKDVIKTVRVMIQKKTANPSFCDSRESQNRKWHEVELTKKECQFAYRDSVFKHMEPQAVILSAELSLQKNNPGECLARMNEKLAERKIKQPLESSSAGCLFKNFEFKNRAEIGKLESRAAVPENFIAARRISAGWIIEELGLKGYRIGDAQVSEKHGNFVLNLGQATADHVVQLIALIKTRARDECGVQLREEVQYVGF